MQPGLSRAIPMAILGFLFGSLLVIVLRFLQSLDPIWAAGPGLVVSVIFTAIFFMWGMGAFDPKLSAHGGEAESHAEEPEPTEPPTPRDLIMTPVWTISTLVLVVVGLMWAFALIPGGFALRTTVVPGASLTEVGYFTVTLFGRDLEVSQLVAFMIFFIFTMGSLAVIGGAIGWFFNTISRGLVEARAGAAPAGAPQLTGTVSAPAASPISIPPTLRWILTAAVTFVVVYFLFNAVLLPWTISHAPEYITPFALIFALLAAVFVARPPFVSRTLQIWALIAFLFGILYFVFYEVAVGMVINEPFTNLYLFGVANQRIMASLTSAIIFAVLIVRPSWVVWVVGRLARIVLNILRALPRFLFQR